ncbi:MAG TPA: class I SAM-dependent methyltransferase [Nitrospiraceae bacterium]|nr:class I SAM-dependent methyltransferase [Nitrospiraceae bacterium]
MLNQELLDSFASRVQHASNKIVHDVPSDVKRGRFLDIGCGVGNGLVAAVREGFQTAVGIDRDLHEFEWFKPEMFDALALANGANPDQSILLECDLFQSAFAPRSFDCVFMLDSIEHVPAPDRFIEKAAGYVADNGVLLIDTCPLYYSKAGHHLFNHFDPAEFPWVHLRKDFRDLVASKAVDAWSMDRFEELNKTTIDHILTSIEAHGLQIERLHRPIPSEEDWAVLEKHRENLDLSLIPDIKLLFEDWILLVARRRT